MMVGAEPAATKKPGSPAPWTGDQKPPGATPWPVSGEVVTDVSCRDRNASPGPPLSSSAGVSPLVGLASQAALPCAAVDHWNPLRPCTMGVGPCSDVAVACTASPV